MKLGPAVRRLLPHAMERRAAQLYRIVFVRLGLVAEQLKEAVPAGANVLDIGGGDGELLNFLLAYRPDIRVTMVDIAPSVGRFVEGRFKERVRLLPATSIEDHLRESGDRYDTAIVSDVMHHIPKLHRKAFVEEVFRALKPGAPLLVKDIEPGHPIAWLSFYADRYVSGDKGVSLVSMKEMTDLVNAALPSYEGRELGLLDRNAPNYILMFAARSGV